MNNKSSNDAQLFVDCAFFGYLGGMQALLKANRRYSHTKWVEALEGAALARNREVVHFILWQFVAQKCDIIVDSDWLKAIDEREPRLAHDIEVCDRYVRCVRMQAKLREKNIMAPDIKQPEFLRDPAYDVYEFGEDEDLGIVGDHSQRRRSRLETQATQQAEERAAGSDWKPVEAFPTSTSSWPKEQNQS